MGKLQTYHCHVLAWIDKGRVGEEGVDNAAEHDWFCGEGDEVSVPVCFEFGTEGFDFFVSEAQFCAYV